MLAPRSVFLLALAACSSSHSSSNPDAPIGGPDAPMVDAPRVDAPMVDAPMATPCTGTPTECAALWEQNASDRFDGLLGNPADLAGFLRDVPKGGDLHNHLSGAVWAESYLDWAKNDGDCISSTFAAVSSCTGTAQAVPSPGAALFDQIVGVWSMEGFVEGAQAQTGHDHFFATFGKYGLVAGRHRDDTIADVVTRAASENQVYVETMFNLGKNVGTLAATNVTTTVTAQNLDATYNTIVGSDGAGGPSPAFVTAVAQDVNVVKGAYTGYRTTLGCGSQGAPAACNVGVRFIAQVSRTGAADSIFGQLISAYEMAKTAPEIVGANLSSPEDDSASINNYDLHMAMLAYLRTKYAGVSPLHITLHAGELVPEYTPTHTPSATSYHVKAAVEIAHAERIGHGIDIAGEDNFETVLTEMHDQNVMVEVCLSSNTQILKVAGAAHPLATYLAHGVPVALATDDQGVSRSSMAGEYLRAALDQHLSYRQLKTIARTSLEHAFIAGPSLWTDFTAHTPVTPCVATATMGIGDPASTACAAFLATSPHATLQWELERRFLAFEQFQ